MDEILILVRILVNYMLRRETWFVHAISEDASTPIRPILQVPDQVMLIRLLRYIGAGDAEIDEVNANIGCWSRGSTWIDLEPGRRNLLGIRQRWSNQLGSEIARSLSALMNASIGR
jgi:hypothetical protein